MQNHTDFTPETQQRDLGVKWFFNALSNYFFKVDLIKSTVKFFPVIQQDGVH